MEKHVLKDFSKGVNTIVLLKSVYFSRQETTIHKHVEYPKYSSECTVMLLIQLIPSGQSVF